MNVPCYRSQFLSPRVQTPSLPEGETESSPWMKRSAILGQQSGRVLAPRRAAVSIVLARNRVHAIALAASFYSYLLESSQPIISHVDCSASHSNTRTHSALLTI